jgi:hypothetical protein
MNIYRIIIFLAFFILTKLLAQSQTLDNSSDKFEIIYLADGKYASNPIWLKKIRDDWKATGVNLRIFRFAVENHDGSLNWNNHPYEVDDAITKIANAGLDIYIRVHFTTLDNQSITKVYSDNDFQIRSNGERFLNQYEHTKSFLNITSKKSRGGMLSFMKKVVKHLKTFPSKVRKKIKLIVPTISPDDETELPSNTYDQSTNSVINYALTGFSIPEIDAFMKFLQKKYRSIKSLNENWGDGAEFTMFDSRQIQIRKYNWDGIKIDPKSPDYYIFENGRKDFLDFRRGELKKFIDDCSVIVKKAGHHYGVQFGSIYDGLIEFRGFYDPTPLIENADQLITDDILEYYPNFAFSADYSRSLCKYWDWKNKSKKPKKFSTESNWPGYEDHSPEDLIKYWSLQLRTFYEKGASSLFVSHWGTYGGPNNIPEKLVSNDNSFSLYKAWQDTLKKFKEAPIKRVINNSVFHLACEQGLNYRNETDRMIPEMKSFAHNEGFIVGAIGGKTVLEFPLNRFTKIKGQNKKNISYENSGDFVTSYMIQYSPNYLKKNYKNHYLTGTSKFGSNTVINKFK